MASVSDQGRRASERQPWRSESTRLALGLSVAGSALFALVYLAFVHTGVGRRVDQAALPETSAVIEISPLAGKLVDTVPVLVLALALGAVAFARAGSRLASPRWTRSTP